VVRGRGPAYLDTSIRMVLSRTDMVPWKAREPLPHVSDRHPDVPLGGGLRCVTVSIGVLGGRHASGCSGQGVVSLVSSLDRDRLLPPTMLEDYEILGVGQKSWS
jgi:hypothetical protein